GLGDADSGSGGGQAALVEHVGGCEECRGASHAYGQIARIYAAEKAGPAPVDFDTRVLARLAEGRRPRPGALSKKPPLPVLVGAGAALVLLIALLAWPRGKSKAPATSAAPGAPAAGAAGTSAAGAGAAGADAARARPAEAPPPPILAVGNAPIDVNAPALSTDERTRVKQMFDADFLFFEDALGALDAFYPEDEPELPRATA